MSTLRSWLKPQSWGVTTSKCPCCGKDCGLDLTGPLHLVIPPGGLKCSCGYVLIPEPNQPRL